MYIIVAILITPTNMVKNNFIPRFILLFLSQLGSKRKLKKYTNKWEKAPTPKLKNIDTRRLIIKDINNNLIDPFTILFMQNHPFLLLYYINLLC